GLQQLRRIDERDSEQGRELEAAPIVNRQERDGAREQRFRARGSKRAPPSRAETLRPAHAELGLRLAELGPVPVGLLEVVADDLVAFDEIRASFVEPGRKTLVQLRARRLR